MVYSVICSILFPVIMNKTLNLELSGHFFIFSSLSIFFSLIYTTGGFYSPYFIWLISMPPVAMLYMKKKSVYFWMTVMCIFGVMMIISAIIGFEFPNYQPQKWFPYAQLFSYTMVLIICMSVVQLFLLGFKKFNRKLKISNEELQQSNKELERFAYIASHDLKSPLRNIVSFVNLIERRYSKQLDISGNDYLRIVKNNARQMHHLVEDILEYSKTNNKQLQREQLDMTTLLLEIITQLQSHEKYVPSEILFEKIPDLHADPVTLFQLFQNLIENGLKYNKSAQPKINIKFEQQEKYILFKIVDNGIGMEAEYLDSVFEMFRRLHNQETYKGTGIGLAICKKIVQLYDGKIWVASEVGKGSTFYLQFPKTMIAKTPILIETPPSSVTENLPNYEASIVTS